MPETPDHDKKTNETASVSAPKSVNLEPEQLQRMALWLDHLSSDPQAFFRPGNELKALRASASRLVAAIQDEVRTRRGYGVEGKRRRKERKAALGQSEGEDPKRSRESKPSPDFRRCYLCHCPLSESCHASFPRHCVPCGEREEAEAATRIDLSGRRALVTGGRIRIGYQCALALLRRGAQVLLSTRFPVSAGLRFSAESDFSSWRERLEIIFLDLRDLPRVEAFARELSSGPDPLDYLINNAAQTIRRDPSFYAPQLALEAEGIGALALTARSCLRALAGSTVSDPLRQEDLKLELLSARPLGAELELNSEGEPRDQRKEHSWTQSLEEISAAELVEVQAINAIAPALLVQGLLPALRRSAFADRHVINVASAEGRFDLGRRDGRHSHTNMAKASLAMLTRSMASELAPQGIYVNSVDPGWVSDMQPPGRRVEDEVWQAPLTPSAGAARILSPIYAGARGQPVWGRYLRNFESVPW